MRTVERLTQFKRDYKKQKKRNKEMTKLHHVMMLLIEEKPIPQKYRDHNLTGN